MPRAFKWSCFISYRHNPQAEAIERIRRLRDDLRTETKYFFDDLDEERLKGGEFWGTELAENLCRSVCMLMVYTPTYFSADNNFCAREYHAMCRLEQQRLDMIGMNPESSKGFIIPVVFRGRSYLPKLVSDKRHYYDFEKFVDNGFRRNAGMYKTQIKDIAEYAKQRYDSLQGIPHDVCSECPRFQLPTIEEVGPLLALAANNAQDFAHVRG